MKFRTAKEKFKNYLKKEKGYSDLTVKNYIGDLDQFFKYNFKKNVKVRNITTQHINDFLNDIMENFSASTRNGKLYSLRSFFKYLKKYKYVRENPADIIEGVKVELKSEPVYLKRREVKEFLTTVENDKSDFTLRNKAIVYTFLFTGLRVSELVNLNIENIDFEERVLKFYGKGKKERIVPLHNRVYDVIVDYINNRNDDINAVFLTRNNNRMSVRTVQRIIKEYVEEANINKNITPHKLRHTFASMFYEKTKDLKSLQELLGHSDISTTQIYTHTSYEQKKKQINSLSV